MSYWIISDGCTLYCTKFRDLIRCWGKFFSQRVVRRWHSCPVKLWCPIPGGAQGQVGWGPGQPQLGSIEPMVGVGLRGTFQLNHSPAL